MEQTVVRIIIQKQKTISLVVANDCITVADYWKSNDRKFCEYCKCWITDNKASVSFHENGKRHKAAIANRISEISRKSAKLEREKAKFDHDLRKMEEAALKSYAVDISSKTDINGDAFQKQNHSFTSTSKNHQKFVGQVDPIRLVGDDYYNENSKQLKEPKKLQNDNNGNESLWIEGRSDKGYTYYWNVKTYESVWEPPKEGFMELAEYEKLDELAKEKQEQNLSLEANNFRQNIHEEIARYNREKLKMYRQNNLDKKQQEVEPEENNFRTEEEATSFTIGNWEIVEEKKPDLVDLELPKVEQKWMPPVVSRDIYEPPKEKKFKEKIIGSLEPSSTVGISISFNKRKTPKGVIRQRLNE